jgi:pyruvate dehydrogenase E2 component (dihydrolipoamide acetyltransferase)
MILKALSNALVRYPKWNSFFEGDNLIGHTDVNLGVAIALDEGLIVPALIGVQNMSLIEVSRASRDLGKRARGDGGTLIQDELTKGTFGTSNLGMFGTDMFSAIIVPPNAGIIAVGAVRDKPVVRGGEIVVGSIMNATISADHRIGDGAEAAVLLSEFQKNLENPTWLML